MSRRAVALAAAGVAAVLVALALVVPRSDVGSSLPTPNPSPSPTADLPVEPALEPAFEVLAAPTASPDPAAPPLSRTLDPLLAVAPLGERVGASVAEMGIGEIVYGRQGGAGLVPASTLKILTAVAALEAVGPDTRLRTRVLSPRAGEIVLVGGGDPMLSTAGPREGGLPDGTSFATLADVTAEALRADAVSAVRLFVDDSFFIAPAVDPDWAGRGYVAQGAVSPVSALAVDGGRTAPTGRSRSADPALAAGTVFAELLAERGVTVVGEPVRRAAPAAARAVAEVRSVPLSVIVEHVLAASDNDAAEVLGRHVAFVMGRPASESGATDAIAAVLGGLGLDLAGVTLRDASGLARGSRIPADVLVAALLLAGDPERPRLRSAVTGLPVAGFTGTLEERFDTEAVAAAAGAVRAKTGTLTRVTSLAGLVRAADGTVYAFAFLADEVPSNVAARGALERAAAALAACGCSP